MNRLLFALIWLGFSCQPATQVQSPDYLSYVNPLVGTDSEYKFSNGNTYPNIQVPFGMTAWTPQSGEFRWIYQYQKLVFQGIRATHQPSPWMADYGQFTFFPFVGETAFSDEKRGVPYLREGEAFHPNYYSLELSESGIQVELTPTNRAAVMRITYPEGTEAGLLWDASDAMGEVELLEGNRMQGISRINSGGVPENFGCYMVAELNHAWGEGQLWQDSSLVADQGSLKGKNIGAQLTFETEGPLTLEIRVATSFISHEQAWQNLKQEVGEQSFETVKEEGQALWEEELRKIEIEGATEAQMTTFYTGVYRCLTFPREFHEYDAAGQQIHYSPYDGKVHEGPMYVDNGFWDTFRAVHPLFTLIWPERTSEIMQALVHSYEEGGWLPKWTSPGYRNVMIGTHTASLFADAWAKGIQDFDVETAYDGMLKDALAPPPSGGPGRTGNPDYLELGYVPSDVAGEATARTLEFAYGDFCVGEMAEMLGKPEDAAYFHKSSLNYRNVFDPEVGFMRGKLKNGAWRPDFVAHEWGGPFTEGSAWHYSWSVMHNIADLIDLMGGEEPFVAKMDSMFVAPPLFDVGHYGFEIHEMTEMVAGGMGQYAHGNQPVHHVVYLYNYARQPWKTQYWARQVVDRLYGPGPDGHCGDEDNGQMSAWYVFSTLGFYPVCPGVPEYALGSPRFDKATVHLPNGKDLVIEAHQQADEHYYVQSASWNGTSFSENWLSHKQLSAGGKLTIELGPEPNKEWGSAESDTPFSLRKRQSEANILSTSPNQLDFPGSGSD
ncbi:MAG: GH92 family glycosyl hydrolase [Bacteroidota bacterium]